MLLMEAVLPSYLRAFESSKKTRLSKGNHQLNVCYIYSRNNEIQSDSVEMKDFCIYTSKQLIKALCSRIVAAASSICTNTMLPQLLQKYIIGLYNRLVYSSVPPKVINMTHRYSHSSTATWRAEARNDVSGWLYNKLTPDPGCQPRFRPTAGRLHSLVCVQKAAQ